MGKWRVGAAVLIGLLCVAAIGVRGFSAGFLGGILFPDANLRRTIGVTLEGLDTAGRPIHILSESASIDRTVIETLPTLRHAHATTLARQITAIEDAVGRGEVLALQGGRQYLELLGYELEWLSQAASAPLFTWARVRKRLHCADIRADRWSPLPGVDYTGRLGIQLPADPDGAMVLIIGDAVPLDIEAESVDGMPIPIQRERLRAGPASTVPADFWLGDGNPWSAPRSVIRLTIDAQAGRDRLLSLRLGRRAPRVFARLRDYDSAVRARICAAPLSADAEFRQERQLVVLPVTPEYFGTGWFGPELGSPELGSVRWMKAQGAILVPSARRGAVEILIRGAPAVAPDDLTTLTLTVNNVYTAPELMLRPGQASYRWTVPSPTWLAGTNELLFTVSRTARASERDTRELGFALQRLELSLIPDP